MTILEKLVVSNTERVSFELEGIVLYFPKELPYIVLATAYEFEGELDVRKVFAKLVTLTAEDEEGNKAFSPDDWNVLLTKGKQSIAPLFTFMGTMYLNFDDKVQHEQESIEKNQ